MRRVLKGRLAVGLVLALTLAAGADVRPAARVVSLTGSAEVVQGAQRIHPAKALERIAPGSSVNVGAGKVQLSFYRDGHIEEVSGPCLVRVEPSGCRVVRGDKTCLARVEGEKRVLLVSRGGNLQSVGGAIAGVSDPSTSQVTPQRAAPAAPTGGRPASAQAFHPAAPPPPPPPPPPPVISHMSSPITSPAPAPSSPTPVNLRSVLSPLEFEYSQDQETIILKAVRGDAEGTTVIVKDSMGSREMPFKDKVLRIPGHRGKTLVVEISREGVLEQKLPIRVLTKKQQVEIERIQSDSAPEHAAIVIDRLDQLGQPYLASRRAESLLTDLQYKDSGLLTYLYDLYSKKLGDQPRAHQIQVRAEEIGLKLP